MKATSSRVTLVTVVAFVVWAVGLALEPRRALYSYLFVYVWLASIVVGSLFFVAIAHTTGATWMVVLRRRAEDVAALAPVLLPLFLPIAFGLRHIFVWAAAPSSWSAEEHDAIAAKHGFLSPSFFLVRAGIYLVSWTVVGEWCRRLSRTQDDSSSTDVVDRQRQVTAATLPWLAFTLTFATFDWVMSLDPTWSSNVLGIYLFAGSFGAACGLLGVLVFGGFASRLSEATPHHGHALGRLLLTFVIFWTYIAFCQYLLIWIADLPREIPWVLRRTQSAWTWVAIALAAIHFVLPFGALLSRSLKLRPVWVVALGAWLIFAHVVDVYWLIVPEVSPSPRPSIFDLAAILFISGVAVVAGILRARGESPMPLRDPRLERGLAYEATP